MRLRAVASQTQRTRRILGQEAVKRSHRRGDLMRLIPGSEPVSSPPSLANNAEPASERGMLASPC